MLTDLVIHGHFYQPPRENPWTGMVDREPSAGPFHDWNERIHHECYRSNAFARIYENGRVAAIVNNYAQVSFNAGPTLMSWLQRHHPNTYQALIDADRDSAQRRGGHGNAIAQGYNHAILPLATPRDRLTQIRWGLADFRHRFGREAESLWLPETAANDATLSDLAAAGLKYVILSPYQAQSVRPLEHRSATPVPPVALPAPRVDPETPTVATPAPVVKATSPVPVARSVGPEWRDVGDGSIDPGTAYKWIDPADPRRSLAIFFYDGPIARAVAFEGALASSQTLMDRLHRVPTGRGRLVHTATDGESYGHHSRFGDRVLAYALAIEAPRQGFRVTNYGDYLQRHPPRHEVRLKTGPNGEGTSWSCAHGVGRWYRDCGCNTGAQDRWNQAWRTPLRQALDGLRDHASWLFENEASSLLADPWAARDDYIEVLLNNHEGRDAFIARHARRALTTGERTRALVLLATQHDVQRMYTSCGWFFADISGIETIQILRYAGCVMDRLTQLNLEPRRTQFLDVLAGARSNVPTHGTGADIFRTFVEPARVAPRSVAGHLAIAALVERQPARGEVAGWTYRRSKFKREQRGRLVLATAHLRLEERATGRRLSIRTSGLHFGGVDFYGVSRSGKAIGGEPAPDALWEVFRTRSVPAILAAMREGAPFREFGLEQVLPEARLRLGKAVLGHFVDRLSEQLAHHFDDSHRLISSLHSLGFPLPGELRAAASLTLGRRFEREVRRQHSSPDPGDYQGARDLAREVESLGLSIDRDHSNRLFSDMISRAVNQALAQPGAATCEEVAQLVRLARQLGVQPDTTRAQEVLYRLRLADPSSTTLTELSVLIGLAPTLMSVAGPGPTVGSADVLSSLSRGVGVESGSQSPSRRTP